MLEKWAQRATAWSTGDHAKLVADPKVQKVYQDIAVDKVNGSLEHHETHQEGRSWCRMTGLVESGELTPSLKLKRRVIVEKYKEQIDQLYAE